MTKRILFFLIFAVVFSNLFTTRVFAQCLEENLTTDVGEVITYDAFYNWQFIWLNAAKIQFSARDTTINDEKLLKLQSIGVTIKSYDSFFCVRDTFISCVEKNTLNPRYFYENCYEGKDRTYNTLVYNNLDRKLSGDLLILEKKTTSQKTIKNPWPECSFDVMTMVYKARNIDFSKYNVDDKIPISLLIDGDAYPLYLRYLGKEDVTTHAGRNFHCLKFSVLLVEGTVFSGGEDMVVWVTNDQNKVPVAVEAKILIGSVKAQVTDTQGLKYPLEAEY